MKQHLLLLFLLCCAACLFGQNQDVVHLKDGTKTSGTIFEDNPGDHLKIRLVNGGVTLEYTYLYADIEKIEKGQPSGTGVVRQRNDSPSVISQVRRNDGKDALSPEDLGGQTGLVFGFGDGFMGGIRYCPNLSLALEAGLGVGAVSTKGFDNDGNEIITSDFGLQIEAAAHLMGKRQEMSNGKIKSHGLMARVSHVSGGATATSISCGWAQEIFNLRKKKPTRSYLFELGLKASFENSDFYELSYPVLPYLRFRWVWYLPGTTFPPASHLEPKADDVQPPILVEPNEQGQPEQGKVVQRQDIQPKPANGFSGQSYPAPPRKRSIMVATSTGLANSPGTLGVGRNAAGFSFYEEEGTKYSAVSLSPNIGYFFNDGFLAGASLTLSSNTEKETDTKQTTSVFLIGPFARYYGNLPQNARMKWTLEAAIGFGTAKSKYKNGTQTFENANGLFSV
ncbi:MAG: hypothetical protein AAB316_06825, partial [Bacteroidota bacterium]